MTTGLTGLTSGLLTGFALWVYTLMLPSIAKSGWLDRGFVDHGPFGLALLKPEQLFGLAGLDGLTHALLWSLLANLGLQALLVALEHLGEVYLFEHGTQLLIAGIW